MDRLRLVGIPLTLMLLGCGSSSAGRMAAVDYPRITAQMLARAAEPDDKPSGVEQTSFVARPSLRAAATSTAGLPQPEGVITATVMARVNGQPILAEEVINAAGGRLLEAQQQAPPAQWPALQAEIIKSELDQIISREVVLQDATARIPAKSMEKVREAAGKEFDSLVRKRKEQLKLKTDEELRAFLDKQKLSLDEERRQFERTFIMREYLNSRVKPEIDKIDREQMLDYYRKNAKEFDRPERVVWQHMFIDVDRFPSRDEAKNYAEQLLAHVQALQRTEDFGVLAEKYSDGPSKYRKGEGEGNERGTIRPTEMEDLLFRLNPGAAGPVVEAPRGFHVVRLVDRQPGGKIPFEKACPDIKRRLQNQIGQAEYARVIKELRSKAYIENALNK